jgi:putative MATE family efflux protein
MHTSAEVTRQGLEYAGLLFLSAPLIFAFFVVEAAFRGRGDTMTPLKILGFALALNTVLDPLLIMGWGPVPAMGVSGAALATILSRLSGLAIAIYLLRPSLSRGSRGRRGPDARMAWRTVRIGAPMAAAGFFFCAVYVVIARITGRFGTEPLAALGIGHRVETLTYLTCVGFGTAAATLVGQNLGAGQPDRAASLVRRSLLILTLAQLAYTAVLLLLAHGIVSIFTDDPGVIAHGATYLRIVAISQVFMGMEVLYMSAFGGAGSTMPTLAVDLPLTGMRIPLAWFLAVAVGLGPTGVWWAISLSTVAKGLALTAWWSRGTWKSYRP